MVTLLVAALNVTAPAAPAPIASPLTQVVAAAEPDLRAELQQEIALSFARQGRFDECSALARGLPPFRQATVHLALASHLPATRRAEAEQMLLEAQTARASTTSWHKTRLSRSLAVAHARLGHFDAAAGITREITDIEDRAFAQREIVGELARAGDVATARELAGSIEENRRYGTYRQKAGALAEVARLLHARGDQEGAETLLAQANLLIPKKPGWSDGGTIIEVGLAEHANRQTEKSRETIARAEALAQSVGGAWKVPELVRVAAAWREVGLAGRATERLDEADAFLRTLPALERAAEALALARGWLAADEKARARALVAGTVATAMDQNNDAWRKIHVLALLAQAEFGDEASREKAD